MNNEHYLIHKEDYIKHIDEKLMLYSFVQQLVSKIGKLKSTKANEPIMKMAESYSLAAEKLFDSWGIPKSCLVCGNEDAIAELMENELITPEDAGYYPIDDDDSGFECTCGECCNCCADDFAEMSGVMSSVIHNIFGDKVSVQIVIED